MRINENHRLVADTNHQGRQVQEITPHPNGYDANAKNPAPKYIIIHITTGTRVESTISHFRDPSSGVCTHVLIGRDGQVIQFLPFDKVAHHTGYSWWEGESNLNHSSIGIELDNSGLLKIEGNRWFNRKIEIPVENVEQAVHWKQDTPKEKANYPGWEKFTDVQLQAALNIVKVIKNHYPTIVEILGHDEVNLRKAICPGPLFPMRAFRMALFGREEPLIKIYSTNEDTEIYENINGKLPNTNRIAFDNLLPANSLVKVVSQEGKYSIVTVLKTSDPKLKVTGWIQTNSLKSETGGEIKRSRQKATVDNLTDNRLTKISQPIFKRKTGVPTPLLEGGQFKKGTKVRIQEIRGEWALVAALDTIKGKSGLEGWLRTEFLDGVKTIVDFPPSVPEMYHMTSQAVFNDRAQGEDQLGIKGEVEALAETLLLRDVEPPVAIGVMGGWGSGKSFVMYLINQYVQVTRAKRVKKGWEVDGIERDSEIPIFVGHIYQINFNAWTYAKSNLWASLMDTIFSSLNRQMQLERLLAHRNFSPEATPPSKEQLHVSMLAGGDEFKKIYLDTLQIDQDKDLLPWRRNLVHWSQHLLKETLLWNIMRGQQVETLDKLKDTDEQLKQLKARREEFEKVRSLEKVAIKELDDSARQAYFQTVKSIILAFVSDALSNSTKDELKKQGVSEEYIEKALKEAKGLWGGLNTIVAAFRRNRIYWIWTLTFLVLTIALPYVWSAYEIAPGISILISLLPIGSALLPWIKKSISLGLEAKKILEGAYVTQQAKLAEEIANSTEKPLPQKISELQTEISNGSLAAYDALIGLLETQAQEQRQKIGPSAKYSNLMEFVQSRLDTATYENQLGLMHQVRQDIDELTFSLVDNANQDVFPRGKPRVILYIDDLDRCPPARVVEVLEAVLLLLNTKLFVVILGLDTRYVTRALEKEYKEILQPEGDPSGLDYIEKIIQIPYRVRSIESDSMRNYIEKQMDIEKEPAAPDAPKAPEPAAPDTSKAPESAAPDTPKAPEPAAPDAPKAPEPAPPDAPKAPEPAPPEIELPAAVIQFKQEDLDDLAACCQKVALTPRSIKRLVNVFKLMKIFWFREIKDPNSTEPDRPRRVKQGAICLLSLSSAYPEIMRQVFVQLETLYRQGQVKNKLFTELNNIKLPPGSAHKLSSQLTKYLDDVDALESISGNGQDKLGQLTLKELRSSTFNIVRSFSFVGDPVYWIDGDEGASNHKKPVPAERKTGTNRKVST